MLNDAPGTSRYRHGLKFFVNRSYPPRSRGHRRFPPRSRSRDREQERADLSSAASNLPAPATPKPKGMAPTTFWPPTTTFAPSPAPTTRDGSDTDGYH
jgi:hypothetical protein